MIAITWSDGIPALSLLRMVFVKFRDGLLSVFDGPADSLRDFACDVIVKCFGRLGRLGSSSHATASVAGMSRRAGVRSAGSDSRSGCTQENTQVGVNFSLNHNLRYFRQHEKVTH
jgi:hypothetical protein